MLYFFIRSMKKAFHTSFFMLQYILPTLGKKWE